MRITKTLLGAAVVLAGAAAAVTSRADGPFLTALPKDPQANYFARMVLERPNNDGEILTAAEKLPEKSLEVTGRWLITAMIKVETTLVDEKGRLKATELVKLQRIVETLAVVSKVLIPAAKERYQQLVSNLGLLLQNTIDAPPEDRDRVRHDFNMITTYTLQAIQLGASALLASDPGEHSPGAATWVTLESTIPTEPGDDDRQPVNPGQQDRPPEASPFI